MMEDYKAIEELIKQGKAKMYFETFTCLNKIYETYNEFVELAEQDYATNSEYLTILKSLKDKINDLDNHAEAEGIVVNNDNEQVATISYKTFDRSKLSNMIENISMIIKYIEKPIKSSFNQKEKWFNGFFDGMDELEKEAKEIEKKARKELTEHGYWFDYEKQEKFNEFMKGLN